PETASDYLTLMLDAETLSVLSATGRLVNIGAHARDRLREETMVDVLGATSTTEDVLSGINLHGKRILVTGVSAGLGVETARSLAAHGTQVVGAARDLKKAEAATALVRRESATRGVRAGQVRGFRIIWNRRLYGSMW